MVKIFIWKILVHLYVKTVMEKILYTFLKHIMVHTTIVVTRWYLPPFLPPGEDTVGGRLPLHSSYTTHIMTKALKWLHLELIGVNHILANLG